MENGFRTSAIWALLVSLTLASCPPEEDLAPRCVCMDTTDGGMLRCHHILSPSELVPYVQSCSGYDMFSIAIFNSSLMFMPHDIFADTDFEKILLVNTQLMSLSDTDVAFEGLENSLIEIRASEATYATQWDISQLRHHTKIDLIEIQNILLESLTEEFPNFPKLKALAVVKAGISYITDKAFAKCPELVILDLSNNLLTSLKRNIFPNPANPLYILKLNNNHLEKVPPDFFEGMPSLYEVNLKNNKLTTVYERPFALAISQRIRVYLEDNPVRCDCRLKWILKGPYASNLEGYCQYPPSLEGSRIRDVTKKELWC